MSNFRDKLKKIDEIVANTAKEDICKSINTIKEEEAVKYVKDILKYPKLYASTENEEDFLRGIDKTKIEKVLNELERYKRLAEQNLKDREEFKDNMCNHRCIKNSEILELKDEAEKYKQLYINYLCKALNNSISQNNKNNDDLEALNEGWKIELKKKDKTINAMATFISSIEEVRAIMGISNIIASQDEIIKYFEKKLENE